VPTTTPVSDNATQPDLVRELIRQIKSDGLSVGDRLPPIRTLAERFEVTGSAVRDAQIQLQTMGLINIMPRSGAVVQSVNFESMVGAFTNTLENALTQSDPSLFHLLDARQLIEVECATNAARKRNMEDLLPLRDALADTLNTAKPLNEESSTEARMARYEADMCFHLTIAGLGWNPVLTTMARDALLKKLWDTPRAS
jgi:DNA-binding FadR family transcriptional regulator